MGQSASTGSGTPPALPSELWIHILGFLLPLHHATLIRQRFSIVDKRITLDGIQDHVRTSIHGASGPQIHDVFPRRSRQAAKRTVRSLLAFSRVNRASREIVKTASAPLWKPLYRELWPHTELANEEKRFKTLLEGSDDLEPDYLELAKRRAAVDASLDDAVIRLIGLDHRESSQATDLLSLHGDDIFDALTDMSRSVAGYPSMLKDRILSTQISKVRRRPETTSGKSEVDDAMDKLWAPALETLPLEEALLALDPKFTQWTSFRGGGARIWGGTSAEGPWLAKRAWASALRLNLLKKQAIKTWGALAEGRELSYEAAISAFSAFRGGDLLEIEAALDRAAAFVKEAYEVIERDGSSSDQHVVYDIVERTLVWTGADRASGADYHLLDNHHIHLVLDNHQTTLPMTMCAIWVAIARRLGIRASLCNFPGQIMVVVEAHESGSWASKRISTTSHPGKDLEFPHWVDVFAMQVKTMEARDLPTRLGRSADWVIPPAVYESQLAPADVRAIVQRTASNIAVSLRNHAHTLPQSDILHSCQAAAFAFIACNRSTAPDGSGSDLDDNARAVLSTALRWLGQTANMDESVWLDSDIINVALKQSAVDPLDDDWMELMEAVQERLNKDDIRTEAKMECVEAMASGRMHPVGTLMRHAKYGYVGIVCGGDTICRQSEGWMQQMNIDDLPEGRNQPFYHVMNTSGGATYVAHENVLPYSRRTPMILSQLHDLLERHPTLGLDFESIDLVESRAIPCCRLRNRYPAGLES